MQTTPAPRLTTKATVNMPFDFWTLGCGHEIRVSAEYHLYGINGPSGRRFRATTKARLADRPCSHCESGR